MKTYYQILKEEGFKRIKLRDKVSFNIHGYHPFLMEKKIGKGQKLSWSSDGENGVVKLIFHEKDGTILKSFDMTVIMIPTPKGEEILHFISARPSKGIKVEFSNEKTC